MNPVPLRDPITLDEKGRLNSRAWQEFFASLLQRGTRSSSGLLANIPTGLGTKDKGYEYTATDYAHVYVWNGTGWEFAPGDPGSGYIVAGGPQGGKWALCDGTVVQVAQPNGTLAAITTPNLTGDVFVMGGAAGAVRVATRPQWEATAKTEDTIVTTGTASPTGSVLQGTGTVISAAPNSHTHTETGSGHHHSLTNANAQLKVPSELNGGLPLRIALGWYIRQ